MTAADATATTNAALEQRLLRISALATLAIGCVGIATGLLIGSRAIVFDGFYSLTDVLMTCVSMLVARLVALGASRHFQFGFWHLEPMLVAFNSSVLLLACGYAFLDGLSTFLVGGRTVAFGAGAAYALGVGLASLGIAAYAKRASRNLHSSLVEIDIRAYVLGGFLSLGLFASFVLGAVLTSQRATDLAPYVDPVILMLLTLVLAPVPIASLIRALAEVFQLAPADLDAEVDALMRALVAELGFKAFKAHVAQAGRAEFIEIDVIVDPAFPVSSVADLDAYRQRIADGLKPSAATRWLTIAFTTDPRWT
ncbi:Predicted Co/Zn/Cd cation transporter, cation efflux family [Arboricoccus pini]|uniref:Predicted Co/Zn/Cd cation transporter, cation efflux family n=1 Tax=Arboricoccus pini TaxID=1963835 RepID=A0A212RT41_9PROT|nr:cation transporter [Arboricoccus pini]SNB75768.1 Predicted Co/Zn/Cd cation transporter, cation efflux family [Arboricoccus pini]